MANANVKKHLHPIMQNSCVVRHYSWIIFLIFSHFFVFRTQHGNARVGDLNCQVGVAPYVFSLNFSMRNPNLLLKFSKCPSWNPKFTVHPLRSTPPLMSTLLVDKAIWYLKRHTHQFNSLFPFYPRSGLLYTPQGLVWPNPNPKIIQLGPRT